MCCEFWKRKFIRIGYRSRIFPCMFKTAAWDFIRAKMFHGMKTSMVLVSSQVCAITSTSLWTLYWTCAKSFASNFTPFIECLWNISGKGSQSFVKAEIINQYKVICIPELWMSDRIIKMGLACVYQDARWYLNKLVVISIWIQHTP